MTPAEIGACTVTGQLGGGGGVRGTARKPCRCRTLHEVSRAGRALAARGDVTPEERFNLARDRAVALRIFALNTWSEEAHLLADEAWRLAEIAKAARDTRAGAAVPADRRAAP